MLISAKIILHTFNTITETEAITWELEYPRFIHSEFMTHRVFSRNSASSRAIPVSKMIEMVRNEPAMPVSWGKNQPGMQAKENLDPVSETFVKSEWIKSANQACDIAENMNRYGTHKQVVNRILEPYQWMKVVMTTTEHANWFNLRHHEAADPTINELATIMHHAYDCSCPFLLEEDHWHIPYVKWHHNQDKNSQVFYIEESVDNTYGLMRSEISIKDALILSTSLCAQVSYRKADDTLEKSREIYRRLVESKPVHASPTEHQLLVAKEGFANHEGWTHVDKWGNWWSGNIRGYVQHRQLIHDNVKRDF